MLKPTPIVSTFLFALGALSCTTTESLDDSMPSCQALQACACPEPPCAVTSPTLSTAETIVPSAAMPAAVISQTAHNNLDITWHNDRLYFAFRTAPSHFASALTTLYVVSTTDHIDWRFEGAFQEGTDLREPRFLSLGGTLRLFYARLGEDPLAFEPGQTRMVEYLGPDQWTPPVDTFDAGFIPWRFKVYDTVAWMTGYTGGASIYSGGPSDLEVMFLKSSDGVQWRPVHPDGATILTGGISETAFAQLDATTYLVGRNEAGDDGGFGSRVCAWNAAESTAWRCVDDPKKYDSPDMFVHQGDLYLIGRRHLSETGYFDQMSGGTLAQQRAVNQANYWQIPKRCALWGVDKETLAITHVLDFPTAGDTCFASVVPLRPSGYLIYDYRSSTDDANIGWLDGQNGPTEVYRITLELP